MKINLNKFELVKIGNKREEIMLAELLGCKAVRLSIKYLGLLLGSKYKDVKTWEPVINLFERRLASWKRSFLYKGGR